MEKRQAQCIMGSPLAVGLKQQDQEMVQGEPELAVTISLIKKKIF